jgi:hypothetical protein
MTEPAEMTAADAKRLLAEEKTKREAACNAAIHEVLRAHRCRLVTIEVRVNGQLADLKVQAEALDG